MRFNRSVRTSASIALGGFPSSRSVPPPANAMRCFVASAAEHSSRFAGERIFTTKRTKGPKGFVSFVLFAVKIHLFDLSPHKRGVGKTFPGLNNIEGSNRSEE